MLVKRFMVPMLVLALIGLMGPSSYAASRKPKAPAAAAVKTARVPKSRILGTVLTAAGHALHRAHAHVYRITNGHRHLVVIKRTGPRGHFDTRPVAGTFVIEVTHRNGSRASAVVRTAPGQKVDVTFRMHKTVTHIAHNSFQLGVHKLAGFTTNHH